MVNARAKRNSKEQASSGAVAREKDDTYLSPTAADSKRTNDVTEGIFMTFLLTMRVIYIFTEPLHCLIMIELLLLFLS